MRHTLTEIRNNWNSDNEIFIAEEVKEAIIDSLINSLENKISLKNQFEIIEILDTQYFNNLSQKAKDGFFLDAAEGEESLLKNFVTFKAHNIIWHLYQKKLFDFKSDAGLEILYRMEQDLPHKLQQTKKLVNGQWYSSSGKKLSDPFSKDQRDEVYQSNKELGKRVLLEKLIMNADLTIKFICNECSYPDFYFKTALERPKTSRSRQFAHQLVKEIDDLDLTDPNNMKTALLEIRKKPIATQFMIVQSFLLTNQISTLVRWSIGQTFFYLSMIKEYLDNDTYSELYKFACSEILLKVKPLVEQCLPRLANSLAMIDTDFKISPVPEKTLSQYKESLSIEQGIISASYPRENVPTSINERILLTNLTDLAKGFQKPELTFIVNTVLRKVDLNYICISDPANILGYGKISRSYLIEAVIMKNYWATYLFMTFGTDINLLETSTKNDKKLSALDRAVIGRDIRIAELLLTHPAIDINVGAYPLLEAIVTRNTKMIRLLLTHMAKSNEIYQDSISKLDNPSIEILADIMKLFLTTEKCDPARLDANEYVHQCMRRSNQALLEDVDQCTRQPNKTLLEYVDQCMHQPNKTLQFINVLFEAGASISELPKDIILPAPTGAAKTDSCDSDKDQEEKVAETNTNWVEKIIENSLEEKKRGC